MKPSLNISIDNITYSKKKLDNLKYNSNSNTPETLYDVKGGNLIYLHDYIISVELKDISYFYFIDEHHNLVKVSNDKSTCDFAIDEYLVKNKNKVIPINYIKFNNPINTELYKADFFNNVRLIITDENKVEIKLCRVIDQKSISDGGGKYIKDKLSRNNN